MTQVANAGSDNVAPQRTPGYLMAPFRWAAMPLAAMLEADPSLYAALFTISRRRMHLIALALAHVQSGTDATFARLIMYGAPRAILDAVRGRCPAGLKRALGHLPVGVLPCASYRHLIELLEEPTTAKLLYHLDSIQGEFLGLLHSIPAWKQPMPVPTQKLGQWLGAATPTIDNPHIFCSFNFLTLRGQAALFKRMDNAGHQADGSNV
jgi:hypothetical protein